MWAAIAALSAGLPQLLTGGGPCTVSENSPTISTLEVQEFSHGGFDGGIEVGFDGTWNLLKFSDLLEVLEEAKNRAAEIQKGPEGFALHLSGEEVLVMATGAKVGGLLYKYRFICRGVEFMVHSNPPKNRQPVRVRYLAEAVQGSRDRFYGVHFEFVLPFLSRLGLVVTADKPSRLDVQLLIDVPASDFVRFVESGHVVTKLRKFSIDGTLGREVKRETITIGKVDKVQVCIYDKGREIRAKKKSIVKETDFIARCVGDEWINSGRPITRIEFRFGREALKCLGVNTVDDFRQREKAILDLVTRDWFRVLKAPKVRGHENTAEMHPVWERVRELFLTYFSGAEVADVVWESKGLTSCDPMALERQALGCLSKALAFRYGEQSSRQSSVHLATGWVDRVQNELHEKLNCQAVNVRIKTGIELGVSVGYDVELDYVANIGRQKSREFVGSFGERSG